jgi:hypothetical protein
MRLKNANGEGNGDSESTNGSNSPFGNHYWLPNVINNHCVLEFIKAIGGATAENKEFYRNVTQCSRNAYMDRIVINAAVLAQIHCQV